MKGISKKSNKAKWIMSERHWNAWYQVTYDENLEWSYLFFGITVLKTCLFFSSSFFPQDALVKKIHKVRIPLTHTRSHPVLFTSMLGIDHWALLKKIIIISPLTEPSKHVAHAGSGIFTLSHAGRGDPGKTALAALASYPGTGEAGRSCGTDQTDKNHVKLSGESSLVL